MEEDEVKNCMAREQHTYHIHQHTDIATTRLNQSWANSVNIKTLQVLVKSDITAIDIGCTTLNSPIFRVGFQPSLTKFLLKPLQVGFRIKPPDWFQIFVERIKPKRSQKNVDTSLMEKGIKVGG